jgi:aryl-alcohol dehydrogenase-like predicted oxidoreductase
MGTLTYSPLAGGWLSGRYRRDTSSGPASAARPPARQKYKKLAALRKALRKMWEIAERYPRMFAHWRWSTIASSAW